MVLRKHNQTAGFSLIEVLVAITILGLVVVPIGSSLVLSFRLKARSGDMLRAQLAVSSAVETIMAEGYNPDVEDEYDARFGASVVATPKKDGENVIYYELEVSHENIIVNTCVRPAPIDPEEGGDES